jgi:hypothetical protein
MAGMAPTECHQTHGFHVFDAIPVTPTQTLLLAHLSSEASCGGKKTSGSHHHLQLFNAEAAAQYRTDNIQVDRYYQ